MISVVIPLYNKAATIRRALASVLSQTIIPDELIIIDDGSTDDSLKVAKTTLEISSGISVKLIEQENSGVSFTRNRGVLSARNDFVAFLDADDEWHTTFIEHAMHEISAHNDISLYTCKHQVYDEAIGCFTPYQNFGNSKSGLIDNYLQRVKNCPLVNSSKVVVNKHFFVKLGGFPEQAKVSEDLFLWIKMAECAPIAYRDELLVTIHQSPDNSRSSRVGEVPYPIIYYAQKQLKQDQNKDLYLYLWVIHLNHVLGSCASNKREALKRIAYGMKVFKLKGLFLFLLLFIPKRVFSILRFSRRLKMVKASV